MGNILRNRFIPTVQPISILPDPIILAKLKDLKEKLKHLLDKVFIRLISLH